MAVQERLSDTNFDSNDIEGASPYIQDYSLPIPSRHTGVVPTDTEYGDMIHKEAPEDDTHDNLDNYIHAQLVLDVGGEQLQSRVIRRATEPDGTKKGMAHRNPLFDTRAYLVVFKDGTVVEYTANIIAENIYSQVDQEGRSFSILQEITDHKVDPKVALNESNGFYLSANRNKVNKKTTQGWKVLVEWKDGFSEWVSLKALKETNPIEVAEYARANLIDKSPAFRWWVPHVLRKRDRIVSKIKSKYWRTTHKFGIRLPQTAAEALQIDKETGTDFWQKAIGKELRKVKIAWEVRDDLDLNEVRKGKHLVGYTEIACHMVFDVKMDFTRKARFVAGGHLTDDPTTITYSSVVSRNSVRIALTIAELNGLDVMCCDMGNMPLVGKRFGLGGGGGGKMLVKTGVRYWYSPVPSMVSRAQVLHGVPLWLPLSRTWGFRALLPIQMCGEGRHRSHAVLSIMN